MKQKTVYLTEKTHNKLKERCKEQGLKLNHLINQIVSDWLQRTETK